MQLPIRSCLFFPFGQASPVPLCRHYPCFPLRGEWRKAPREVSLNSSLFFKPCPCSFFLRKNLQNCQPLRAFPLPEKNSVNFIFRQHSKVSPCLIVLAHNEAKIVSLVPRLPLGGRLLAKQGGEGQLHFRFKILNNSAIPFSIFPLAFPFGNPYRTAAQRQSRQAE